MVEHWYNPYAVSGDWYRGNTHLHTFHGPNDSIRTDPNVVVDWYRNHGYRFLNFSDHCNITEVAGAYDDFIVFSGHESDCVVAIDVDYRPELADSDNDIRLEKLQFWVDETLLRGGIAQIAHPKATLMEWRRNLDYLLSLDGASLFELYNNRQGDYGGSINWRAEYKYAVEIWDELLMAGKIFWPTAVDDSHDYLSRPQIETVENGILKRNWHRINNPDEQFFESGGGWMAVLAEEFTPMHLKLAMRRGSIYASQGPVFESIGVDDEKLNVKTDKPYAITLIADGENIHTRKESVDISLNMPSHEIYKYFRIELADEEGRRAWSAPFISF